MKTIVTHLSPDLDAYTSCWLIKRFLPNWELAEIKYVPAGYTFTKIFNKDNDNLIHVDTGLGKFDHHQTNDYTCATKLVFDHLLAKGYIPEKITKPLSLLVKYVNEIDHFRHVYFPEPDSKRYDFSLHQIIEGLKATINDDLQRSEIVFKILDAEIQLLRNRVIAEEDIKKGFIFHSKWGKTLIMETKSGEALNLGLKMNFPLVIKKDPLKGNVRIKTLPEPKYDLTSLYEAIKKKDKTGTWFLHISKNMLLNGSVKNLNFVPSPLTIKQLIEIVKGI